MCACYEMHSRCCRVICRAPYEILKVYTLGVYMLYTCLADLISDGKRDLRVDLSITIHLW